MKRLILCVLAALCLAGSALGEKKDTCVSCHESLDASNAATVKGMAQDVHTRYGLSCADCHGGNPADEDMMGAMDPARGYRGAPTVAQIPEFCGACHADAATMRRFKPRQRVDQLQLYWTSVHGQRHQKGDQKVAQCVSCHGVHGILPGSDPRSPVYPSNVPGTCARCHSDAVRMAGYGIPTDQFDKYKGSVHGRALLERGVRGAPACPDCHGNHGAVPPGIPSIKFVCGQCHPVNQDLFLQSPHEKPFQESGIPACKTCHSHHDIQSPSDAMLGNQEGAVCVTCHKPGTEGNRAAGEMRRSIEGLKAKREAAERLLVRAEGAGMEVSQARFDLNEVGNALTKARASVHAFSPVKTAEVARQGGALADATIERGERALAEVQSRRRGLVGFLAVLLAVGAGLFLKIREVDRREGV